ncbi:predicted protein [Lichtheimia corymbifera JMRC:FSU:9682]|uniref:Uncharacterized protein n=1 Tax=Lichtheimia corymbifera JMRC:FSU:9682 TaxID=1263082 RepID=A0A068RSK8_9FUNG|nr:predicted protein [Lichtheimia corymbifera JMRC:FSU:9682]
MDMFHLQDVPEIEDHESSSTLSSSTIHVLTDDERERDTHRMHELDNLSANESASISESEPSTEHDEYDTEDPIINDTFKDVHGIWIDMIDQRVSQTRHPCVLCNGVWLCPGCLAIIHSQQDVITHAINTHGLELPFFPVDQIKNQQGPWAI